MNNKTRKETPKRTKLPQKAKGSFEEDIDNALGIVEGVVTKKPSLEAPKETEGPDKESLRLLKKARNKQVKKEVLTGG